MQHARNLAEDRQKRHAGGLQLEEIGGKVENWLESEQYNIDHIVEILDDPDEYAECYASRLVVVINALFDEYYDKKVVLFWASTCPHCLSELPIILENYKKLKQKNIEVVAFALDTDMKLYKEKTAPLPWINDTELKGWQSSYAETYNVHATPTYYVLDKNNKIIENFFNGDKATTRQELVSNDDFTSYDLKSYDLDTMTVTTFKDVLNNDTYLNTKNGIIEYEDGKTIEFTHQNGAMNGPAVENLPNGDKIKFVFDNNKRVGEAEKLYKNGDREIFIYGENNQKNGSSIYYFANGDLEETTYVNGVLQGAAKYVYKDGAVEHYEYKDGKRIED